MKIHAYTHTQSYTQWHIVKAVKCVLFVHVSNTCPTNLIMHKRKTKHTKAAAAKKKI